MKNEDLLENLIRKYTQCKVISYPRALKLGKNIDFLIFFNKIFYLVEEIQIIRSY